MKHHRKSTFHVFHSNFNKRCNFRQTKFSIVKFYNQNADVQVPPGFPNIEVSPTTNEFTLHNAHVTATFSSLGLLKAIKVGSNTIPVHLDFAKYTVYYV